ncbi:MAG: hypothetical protein QM820_17415 [Minicystis sp.]
MRARVMLWLGRHIGRLPPRLQSVAWGVVASLFLLVVRTALGLLADPDWRSWSRLRLLPLAVILTAYGGAVAGLVHSLVRGPLRRLGSTGDYLTGIAVAGGYLLSFAIPVALLGWWPALRLPGSWGILLVVTVLFGLVLGHFWFREQEGPRDEVR